MTRSTYWTTAARETRWDETDAAFLWLCPFLCFSSCNFLVNTPTSSVSLLVFCCSCGGRSSSLSNIWHWLQSHITKPDNYMIFIRCSVKGCWTWVLKEELLIGDLCGFVEEIQTDNFNIYNINAVRIQTLHPWITSCSQRKMRFQNTVT